MTAMGTHGDASLLDRLAAWPKWRIVCAWWILQAAAILAVWSVFLITLDVDFKSPVVDSLARGFRSLAHAIVQVEFWAWYLVSAGAVAILQAAVLLPVRQPAPVWRPGLAEAGRSMWATIAAAGLMIGSLWGGLVLVLGDAVWIATDLDWTDMDEAWRWFVVPPVLGWIVATPLIVRFVRRARREDRLARLSARLFLGTIIEAVAIVPIDVMVRRRTDCYCGRGTFFALVACGTVGVASLGPAALLPLLARRRKRWYAGRCDACLYDMSATPAAERCPECGAGWKPHKP